jgi:hypothetical protein
MVKVTRSDYQARTGRVADGGNDVAEWMGWRAGQEIFCLHCGESFRLGAELVDLKDGLLVCPVDGCDGNPMDWSEESWE